MQKSAQITAKFAMSALLALGVLGTPERLAANPWNPYPAPAANTAQAPVIVQPQGPGATRSRFAPAGLEQQLTAVPWARFAPSTDQNRRNIANSDPTPSAYAPAPQGFAGPNAYAPQGYGFAPNAPAFQPGFPQGGIPQGLGNGGYPQAYGGYPGGFNNYSNQGNGGNGPFGPFGFPGGTGGFNPFSGNLSNGNIPGFNVSPFGFF